LAEYIENMKDLHAAGTTILFVNPVKAGICPGSIYRL
jgi:hypothetical protein